MGKQKKEFFCRNHIYNIMLRECPLQTPVSSNFVTHKISALLLWNNVHGTEFEKLEEILHLA